ncbi:hypothetical protein ACFL3F_04100 [Planctomycetota bacterium]
MIRFARMTWLDNAIKHSKPRRGVEPDFTAWCAKNSEAVRRFTNRKYCNNNDMPTEVQIPPKGHCSILKLAVAACLFLAFAGITAYWISHYAFRIKPDAGLTTPKESTPINSILTVKQLYDNELKLAQLHFERLDQSALLDLLNSGTYKTKLQVARYLGTIGDMDALPALQRLSSSWEGQEGENHFAMAIEKIQAYYTTDHQPEVIHVPSTDLSKPVDDSEPYTPTLVSGNNQVQPLVNECGAGGTVVEFTNTQKLTGLIVDPNDRPVADARVCILPMTLTPTWTDQNGEFELWWSPSWFDKYTDNAQLDVLVQEFKHNLASISRVESVKSRTKIQIAPANSIKLANLGITTMFLFAPAYSHLMPLQEQISNAGSFVGALPDKQSYLLCKREGPNFRVNLQNGNYPTDKGVFYCNSSGIFEPTSINDFQLDESEFQNSFDQSPPLFAQVIHVSYDLKPDEILRFIKAPFVVERQDHLAQATYWQGHSLGGTGISQSRRSGYREEALFYYFSVKANRLLQLSDVFNIIHMNQELDIDESLQDIRFPPGDWIVRTDVPLARLAQALEAIVLHVLQRDILFTEVQRDNDRGRRRVWLVTENE